MKGIVTSSTLLILLTAGVTAEPETGQKRDREKGHRNSEFVAHFFSKLDVDRDGTVNEEEFAANPRLELATAEQRAILFKRLDKDGDGVIKPDELRPPKGMRPGERPPWLRNGPVTFEQFSQQPRVQRLSEEMRRKLFERLDQNEDGILSKRDIPRDKGPRPDGRSQGPPSHRSLDADRDGKISFAEFQSAPFNGEFSEDKVEERFQTMDLGW